MNFRFGIGVPVRSRQISAGPISGTSPIALLVFQGFKSVDVTGVREECDGERFRRFQRFRRFRRLGRNEMGAPVECDNGAEVIGGV